MKYFSKRKLKIFLSRGIGYLKVSDIMKVIDKEIKSYNAVNYSGKINLIKYGIGTS